MIKHRGFPGRLPGSDFQFTLRRANPKGATPLVARERYRDPGGQRTSAPMRPLPRRFGSISAMSPLSAAISMPGGWPGSLGAKCCPMMIRFDPEDYEARLIIDVEAMRRAFPEAME